MKKLSLLVLLIAIAITGLSLYRIQDNGGIQSGPWNKRVSLQNLSRVAEAESSSLVVIGQSKQEIVRLSRDGAIEAEIRHDGNGGTDRRDYTEAVVDGSNRTIVLDTALDSYGLIVQKEQIIRFDEKGGSPEVLYEWQGNGQSKRIGQLKGLQVQGDLLYFFLTTAEKVSLMRLPLSGGQPEEALSFTMPKDRYLSEIKGTEKGQIYYTTKRGAVFRVMEDGTSEIVYPLASMERTRKNFPERLSIDSSGKLFFVDRLLNSVTTMEPGLKSLDVLLSEESIMKSVPGAESYEIMDVLPTGDGGYAVVLNDRLLIYDNQNRLAGVLSQVKYQNDILFADWVTWGFAIAGVLLLLFALRLVYKHLMNGKISLFFKQLIVTVPVIVICMLLLSNFIYNSFSARMEDEMQRELSLLARNGQQIIDGDRLERLHSPKDYRNEDYENIRGKMNFLFEGEQSADRQGLYSTLYKYDEGHLYILMDDDDGVNMFKPFEMNEENDAVRNEGVIRTGQWEDANGKWLYAIGPVYNSKHEVVGIYETGRDMSVLYQANHKIYQSILKNIVIITSVILIVILAGTFLMLSTVRKLRRSVIEMADGNWDVEVRVNSRDEVGDLGQQFNRMARYIRQYIADITQFSEASYRFVPQQFFKSLGKKGILDIRLGDQVQQNMSVMIANLRGFRKLSQTLTPMENFNFMNSFLRRFGPLVRKEDGLISKYLGAGFMALFPGYAEEALNAAIAIRQELTEYNAGRRRAGYVPVDIGIAIHRGPLMMGIIGEERRWEGNVISDDVHLTATLEKLSEELGASVLVTRDLFEQLREPERYRHRSLGRITPEGQESAIELIDVYEGDSEQLRQAKDRTRALFERGLMLCQEGRFYDARETFVEVIKQNRMDKAAKLYFYLCDEYYQKGTSTGWNGTLAV
ncbi:adenylate/guanylate cyclase domain-containing protein [Cohnella cholangitidis]|uniref:HAMP domain-containing protein n=1 Tax=Cohnella cholangitidis TaxID=2598458 RepID=A0A7G5BVV8_9BACL|nr:adenylate/guanylate cyclase domain-containing protein [Cohnella cholangitidis]QMV41092.1 HAMP domain-containing protein [Cohnella cholangitidis]